MMGLQLLDVLLTSTHMLIVGFNLFGWIWPKTRRAHLIVVTLTASCWLILGIWYGIGYCPVTDWQWRVKERLGEVTLPNSFIKYWADRLTGGDTDSQLIDIITGVCFAVVVIFTIYLNFFNRKNKINANA